MFAIPLAWLQLIRERVRLLVALAGIGFAVILMFIQLGFRDALFESAVRIHLAFEGDVFLVSPQSSSLIAMDSFSRRRLLQAQGVEGVESITPIYMGFGLWKDPDQQGTRGIFVIGIEPTQRVFPAALLPDLEPIKQENVILFDRDSRDEFGPVSTLYEQNGSVETELNSRRVRVGGLFTLGASFGADGNIVTSDLNFQRIFGRDLGQIEVGLIRLQPEADLEQVIGTIQREIADVHKDVMVFSKEEFVQFERNYWETSTSIGFIFNLGAVIGWVVGTVIVYQILYTDVADHLAEYATLKAMGYRNIYLLSVVFQEAIILSVMGFIPAFFVGVWLYKMTYNATALPIYMTQERGTFVFVLTMVMCVVSGAIAVRKVQEADPADIF